MWAGMKTMNLMRLTSFNRVWPKLRILPSQLYCTQGGDADISEINRPLIPALSGERGVNKVTLLGRVGRDPEVRGNEEYPVTVFSLATSNSYKQDDGGYKQYTDWHRIAIFRPVLRDLVYNSVKKGDRVYVSGAIRYGSYEDSSGNMRQSPSIVADDVIFLKKAADKFGPLPDQ